MEANKVGLKIKGATSAISGHINQTGYATLSNDFFKINGANREMDL